MWPLKWSAICFTGGALLAIYTIILLRSDLRLRFNDKIDEDRSDTKAGRFFASDRPPVNIYEEFVQNGPANRNEPKPLKEDLMKKFVYTNLSLPEKVKYRSLVKRFDAMMLQLNITYFIFSGTLIGAYRHHGPIPWDDDFDVQVPVIDLPKIKKAFDDKIAIVAGMFLKCPYRRPWKISYEKIKPTDKAWPFVDLWPYAHLGDYMKDDTYQPWVKRDYEEIFPLVRVPFMGYMLPAPRKWKKVIVDRYGDVEKKCASLHLSHRNWQYAQVLNVECWTLSEHIPFVTRDCIAGVITETLKIGKTVLDVWNYTKGLDDVPEDDTVRCKPAEL